MNCIPLMRKVLSVCLSLSVLAALPSFALSNPALFAGELAVAGNGVLVNGQPAENGRSIFSGSTVATPENAVATINFGKLGNIQIAPNSSVSLSFDDKAIEGNLSSGMITVLGAADTVNVTTLDGATARLSSGESVQASGAVQTKDDDPHVGKAAWLVFGVVLVAAGAIMIYSTVNGNDRIALGGGGTVVSPTR
jgi:hypothetical protein